MLFFFKNHIGMVVSIVIAMLLSFFMVLIASLMIPAIQLSVELFISNWGSVFLTIMLISMFIPAKLLGDKFAAKVGLKPGKLPFGLVSNLIPTLFYNTGATLVIVGVNVGFAAPFYWAAVGADIVQMYIISYFLSLIAERIGMLISMKAGLIPKV